MKEYIQENRERFFEELFSLLRIPSISAKQDHKKDMERCAERLKELLLEAGADEAGVYPSKGNPVVFGKKIINPEWKTVMVYGHYDVQPPEPLEKWHTDPFEPVIKQDQTGQEAIYARGANDDKGQLFMHIKAFEYLLRSGKLRHNVKFIFEGEEEIGSPSLPAWVKEHKKWLGADVILVSDTTMISDKVPSINCGMRGMAYLEVTLTGPDKDLHSGHYGGTVANPIQTLCDLISGLIDKDGRVTIPGFYDDVVELSRKDRAQLARAPFDLKEFEESVGVKALRGEKGYTPLERIGIRPCLDVCGIWGGYIGEGAKTVSRSRQDLDASRAESGEREDHEDIQETSGEDRSEILPHRGQAVRGWRGIPHSDFVSGVPGCFKGYGGGLWRQAGSESWRRQHRCACGYAEDPWSGSAADGIRP